MIRKNKKSLIAASLVTLLPILVGLLLWNKLPDMLTTHWGADGHADGWTSLPFAVFVPPLLMLAGLWVCVFFTGRDPGNKDRNEKPQRLVLWIIPIMSNLCCGMIYALALGMDFSPTAPMGLIMGIMFIFIGNYLPKCRQNATIGIKVPWAYTSEENWNATHRFGGKVWVIGGILMLFSIILPEGWSIAVLLTAVLVLTVVPTVYSWQFYRKQLAEGDALTPIPQMMGKTSKISIVFLVILAIVLIILMFTGEVKPVYGETSFTIEASWYADLTVEYASIDSIEYREGNVDGTRVGGWGSGRLLLGFFHNEEFGNHTRYTYVKPESCVVLHCGNKILVISGRTAEESEAIYKNLLVLTDAE